LKGLHLVHTPNKYRRAIAVSLMMAFVLLTQVSAAAQKSPRRIRFERGHSSTTVSGRIVGYEAKDYVVGAQAGQELTLRVKDTTASTYFVIYSINGKLNQMSETDEWSEVLTESGDYVIRVFMMRSAARRKGAVANYKLNISIH
jgi:hypothetical protein